MYETSQHTNSMLVNRLKLYTNSSFPYSLLMAQLIQSIFDHLLNATTEQIDDQGLLTPSI